MGSPAYDIELRELSAPVSPWARLQEISANVGLRGGPGSSDARQSGQWLACQSAPKGPFERKRVSQQVSKSERYVCRGTLSPILFKGMPLFVGSPVAGGSEWQQTEAMGSDDLSRRRKEGPAQGGRLHLGRRANESGGGG